jgi:hypothetical protein
MKRNILCAALVLIAGSLLAADKDDVSAAIAKLDAAPNYSWTSTNVNANAAGGGGGRRGGGFGGGPASGKTIKGGLTAVTRAGRGGNPGTESYLKGTNGVFQNQDGDWQTIADAMKDDGSGQPNMAAFGAINLQNTKTPAQTAQTLLAATKSLTKTDNAYSGELTDDGAKGLLQITGFGGRGGGNAPQITVTDAKASVKFWVKDGVLTKYEIKSTGKTQFGDNDPMEVNRTTTVEIKDIGTTKIEVPDEAKKKLS